MEIATTFLPFRTNPAIGLDTSAGLEPSPLLRPRGSAANGKTTILTTEMLFNGLEAVCLENRVKRLSL